MKEIVERYAEAWTNGEYDTDPSHVREWLEDESLWTDEDRQILTCVDLADLADRIVESIKGEEL